MLVFFLLVLLTFLIRYIPRLLFPYAVESDTYFHVDIARRIQKNRFKTPLQNNNYIIPHRHLYPYFYHKLLALFGERTMLYIEQISSPMFDTLIALTGGMFGLKALSIMKVNGYQDIVNYAILLYCVSPSLLRVTNGPRSYSGSPRILGQLLFLMNILFFLLYIYTSEINYLFLSAASLGLILITAKFALQVVVFLLPFVLIFISWEYAYSLFLGFLFAVAVTWGKVLSILKNSIVHSYYYYLYQQSTQALSGMSITDYLRKVLHVLRLMKKFNAKMFFNWIFYETFYIHILVIYFIPVLFDLVNYQAPGKTPVYYHLWIIILASVVTFFLTANKPLLFLGQAERYLEFIVMPSLLLLSVICYANNWMWLYFIFLGFLVINLVYIYPSIISYLRTANKNYLKFLPLAEFMKGKNQEIVLPLAYHNCKSLVYHCKCRVLSYYPGGMDSDLFSVADREFLYKNGEQDLSENIIAIFEKYNVKYLFAFEAELTHYIKETYAGGEKDFYRNFKVVYSANQMLLLTRQAS